ncbi:hypothetical protein [Levilactobacillus phage ENFP1]|nr:hypothetical protein [Levilactobacillus phage ENFP1]
MNSEMFLENARNKVFTYLNTDTKHGNTIDTVAWGKYISPVWFKETSSYCWVFLTCEPISDKLFNVKLDKNTDEYTMKVIG